MAAQKQRKMISFENLDKKLQEMLKEKYPNGFAGHTQRIETPKETFNVVTFETKDTIFMVKVKLTEKKRKDEDDDDDDAGDIGIPDSGPGFDDDKDEFGDDEEEDNYGDEPVEEGSDDEDED